MPNITTNHAITYTKTCCREMRSDKKNFRLNYNYCYLLTNVKATGSHKKGQLRLLNSPEVFRPDACKLNLCSVFAAAIRLMFSRKILK